MRRSIAFLAAAFLVASCLVGFVFVGQTYGVNGSADLSPVQAQPLALTASIDWAVVVVVALGSILLLVRPRRRAA